AEGVGGGGDHEREPVQRQRDDDVRGAAHAGADQTRQQHEQWQGGDRVHQGGAGGDRSAQPAAGVGELGQRKRAEEGDQDGRGAGPGGTVSASPYGDSAMMMFAGLGTPVPIRPGSSTNSGREGIAYIREEPVVTEVRSQPRELASLASGSERRKAIRIGGRA